MKPTKETIQKYMLAALDLYHATNAGDAELDQAARRWVDLAASSEVDDLVLDIPETNLGSMPEIPEMVSVTNAEIKDLLSIQSQPLESLVAWLNDVGLKVAAEWLTKPNDAAADSYAAAILSLCASLPPSTIERLDPRRLATLAKLRAQARAIDESNS